MNSDTKSILLIDDNKGLTTIYRTLLEEEGFQVAVASCGEEGLEVLRNGFHPQLILVDVLMPGMDGQEFIEAAEKENLIEKSETCTIGFSSLDAESPVIKKISSHVHACEQKPWGVDGFLDLIHKYT